MLPDWTIADVEAPLGGMTRHRKMWTVLRQVLEELQRARVQKPTLEVRAASVRLYWSEHDDYPRLSIDRAGVVRACVWVVSCTFHEPDKVWRKRGTDVARVISRFVEVAGLRPHRVILVTSGKRGEPCPDSTA